MMRSIIFCEGKTDGILLSYYLGKVADWNFDKRLTKNIGLPIRNWENEEVSVYTKREDELVIWAVGGQSNFDYAISQIIKVNRLLEKTDTYKKLIILTDRDKTEEDKITLERIENILKAHDLSLNIKDNNYWTNCVYFNDYGEKNEMYILPIIIPFDKNGALETFILDAISEMGEEENYVVNKSKEYISAFNLINYLNTQRLKVKGELAVTLGTLFPEKTFSPIDSMLKNINWEEYRTIQEGFRKLEEI